jgi:hypothetical protein
MRKNVWPRYFVIPSVTRDLTSHDGFTTPRQVGRFLVFARNDN